MVVKTAVKQEAPSIYVTGFCGIGSHENSPLISPSGKTLRACPVGGRIEGTNGMGRPIGEDILCTCLCHSTSREMETLTGVKFPAFSAGRTSPALSRLGLLSAGGVGTNTGKATGSVDMERPTVAVASGARFAVTPTGRAARGQLEEQVRYHICRQVRQAGEDMIALLGLNPTMLAKMIDAEDPPSTGAIHAVLKRWDNACLVELGESPFRFIRFTDRGKRDLFR